MRQPANISVYPCLLLGAVLPALGEIAALRRDARPRALPGTLTLLAPRGADLRDAEVARAHARIAFGIALRGAQRLSAHDPVARDALRNVADGLASFEVREIAFAGWLKLAGGRLEAGIGAPPAPSAVKIAFPDCASALATLRGELDALAAVGSGAITISGHLPLAERVSLVLARLADYFPPRP